MKDPEDCIDFLILLVWYRTRRTS